MADTDVMHDPNYLIANLSHANARVRLQAQEALANLQRENQEKQQLAEFALRQRQTAMAQQNTEADRRQHEAELAEYRQSRLASSEEGREATRMQHLGSFLANPPRNATPEELQAAKEQYYGYMKIPVGLTEQQQRENKVRADKGLPPIQAPGMPAPASKGVVPPHLENVSNVVTPADLTGFPMAGAGGDTGEREFFTKQAYFSPENQEKLAALARNQAETGRFESQSAVASGAPHGEPGSFYYDPATKTNYRADQYGAMRAIGGGDPSVGALEEATREPMRGGGDIIHFPSGGTAKVGGVPGETAARRALREPAAPTMEAQTVEPFAPSATAQTNASTAGGGSGAPVGTPGSATPTLSEAQVHPSRFSLEPTGLPALGRAFFSPEIQGVLGLNKPAPTPFAPSGTVAQQQPNAANPLSAAQNPPPLPQPFRPF